ncbi:response regulator [Planktothrix sp. FACHB-1355]|uniref:Response regulator n=1 Tax=Aerosakkonema funiforme FACHB-1375 TaxID=2949571 RepID=A0A926ZHU7_9CYAN|nr:MULTISPECIES: response regulator [Oscillatoriales]MBD2183024.1 response regulator [Aerosakkonema funiforme FACHB-1375]MBD3559034.1 response regulator [Planktothrix sp. FACHB-1355]
MTSEEALQLIEATLKSKTGKQLTLPEKEILKAAWDNETYTKVAESLFLSIGYIKDLASLLWQRLSDVFGEKITKNNLRLVIETLSPIPCFLEEEIAENHTDESSGSKGNILIVDDPSENLLFLTYVLTKRGYKVRSVTNSQMALRSIGNNPPDIILLDIKMPEMDGYKVCQALKADETTSEIPIIFLSALDEVMDKVKAFKVGGVDYITKPFQPEEVIARIQNQLTIQQQKRQLREQIQQHQQTVEILYQSRALLARLLNSSQDGIAAWEAVRDPITEEISDFQCLVVNPVFAKLFGQQRTDLMEKFTLKKLLNQLNPTLFDSLVKVVERGATIEREFYWKKDNLQIWYRLMAVKFGDGCLITVHDITNFKLLEYKINMEAQLLE